MKNNGTVPTDTQLKKIYYNFSIKDVLDEEQFIEKMLIVRYRVICAFVKSIDPTTKKGIHGNYIMGVGLKLSQLKKFLHSHINHQSILLKSDLPKELKKLNQFWINFIISKAVRVLINLQIDEILESKSLWFLDQAGGVWEISQSLADEVISARNEYLMVYSKKYNSTKPRYHDQRNYHGRPSQQGRRRNRKLRQAPGLSTSTARNK